MKEKLIITIIILLYSIYINAKAQNVYPVEGANWDNITSTFGPRLLSEGYDTHRGLDVKGSTSEKVVSIADGGRVIVAESDFRIIEYLIAGFNTAIEDGEGGNSSEVNAIMPSQGTVKSKRL